MKLDLVEINKLSPPDLWDLEALSAVISMLLGVVKFGFGGQAAMLIYVRMIDWHTKNLRAKTRENLNIRIKAWVMQCPARIAWVRHIIGEAAIKKWQKNRLADYALSKYFGDWKRKWPNGFTTKTINPEHRLTPKYRLSERAYNWKFFALVRIINVERFLYGQARNNTEIDEIQVAYQKLWNVDILDTTDTGKWAQPRKRRTLKPVTFTPNELVVEAATGTAQDDEKAIEQIETTDVKRLHAPPDTKPEKNEFETEEQKPP